MGGQHTGDDILSVSLLNSFNFSPRSTSSTFRSTFKVAMDAQASSLNWFANQSFAESSSPSSRPFGFFFCGTSLSLLHKKQKTKP